MGPVIAAVNEQPLVAGIVNEDQQDRGRDDGSKAHHHIVLYRLHKGC